MHVHTLVCNKLCTHKSLVSLVSSSSNSKISAKPPVSLGAFCAADTNTKHSIPAAVWIRERQKSHCFPDHRSHPLNLSQIGICFLYMEITCHANIEFPCCICLAFAMMGSDKINIVKWKEKKIKKKEKGNISKLGTTFSYKSEYKMLIMQCSVAPIWISLYSK